MPQHTIEIEDKSIEVMLEDLSGDLCDENLDRTQSAYSCAPACPFSRKFGSSCSRLHGVWSH